MAACHVGRIQGSTHSNDFLSMGLRLHSPHSPSLVNDAPLGLCMACALASTIKKTFWLHAES